MKRGILNPPAIQAPAPRQPSFGSVAAKAQAKAPGCQNPNRAALWAFAGTKLRILEVPKKRFRSFEEERDALTGTPEAPKAGTQIMDAPTAKAKPARKSAGKVG